jgi:hypothetical protein
MVNSGIVAAVPLSQEPFEELSKCACMGGGPGLDFHEEMRQTAMLDQEENCIPAAWEGFECQDHPIIVGLGELATGDVVSQAHEISYGAAVVPAQVYTTYCDCYNNTCSHAE